MKKILLFIAIIFVSYSLQSPYLLHVFAETDTEKELEYTIENQIDELELNDINSVLSNFDNLNLTFLNNDIKSLLKEIIEGKDIVNISDILGGCLNNFINTIKEIVPFVALLIAIIVTYSLINGISTKDNGIKSIIYLAFISIIIIFCGSKISNMIDSVKNVMTSLTNQMQIFFPIILTLMTTLGGSKTVGLYQPTVVILINIISQIMLKFVLPIFIIYLIFSVISSISTQIKFSKSEQFFSKLYKWIIGIVFTIFTAFVSIQGLTASTIDNVSLRTIKYSIRSYIPYIGGTLSDGLSMLMASSVLIKNALGIVAFLCLFSTILLPIIELIVFKFAMLFVASVSEPISDIKFSEFTSKLSSGIDMLIAVILAISFMYFIMLGLIISSSNVF